MAMEVAKIEYSWTETEGRVKQKLTRMLTLVHRIVKYSVKNKLAKEPTYVQKPNKPIST